MGNRSKSEGVTSSTHSWRSKKEKCLSEDIVNIKTEVGKLSTN